MAFEPSLPAHIETAIQGLSHHFRFSELNETQRQCILAELTELVNNHKPHRRPLVTVTGVCQCGALCLNRILAPTWDGWDDLGSGCSRICHEK